ncbi:MAG: hypothetical protein H0V96_13090 [Acidimicrobiia bacterium]|nr:hypothetical protein [Acidimicrobiia bacterium]
MEEHVATLLTAIDQVVAGDVAAVGSLKTAAAHMPMLAEGLSGAIATRFPDQFAG